MNPSLLRGNKVVEQEERVKRTLVSIVQLK